MRIYADETLDDATIGVDEIRSMWYIGSDFDEGRSPHCDNEEIRRA